MPSNTDDLGRVPADSAARGYETRDANTKGVLVFLAVLFVVISCVLLGSWGLFRHFSVADAPPAPASSFSGERQLPPPPELQTSGRVDFQHLYDEQQQELKTYGWVDRQAGAVRLPIDRAMDLLVQKGLPTLPAAAQPPSTAEKSPAGNSAVPADLAGTDQKQGKGELEQ